MLLRFTLTAFLLLFVACKANDGSASLAVQFDGEAAFRYLVAQCDFGPRVPNTPAHRQALEMIVRTLDSLGIVVERQEFKVKDPYSQDTLRLTNVIARINPSKDHRLLFGAHWDSRPRCEMDPDSTKRSLPLLGANDGASGTAVLLQLACELTAQRTSRGIDLAFFDGEDWGEPGDLDYYCLGSKEFARRANARIYDYAVVLDLVGDRDQQFFREEYSVRYQGDIVNRIWERAAKLGMATVFDNRISQPIYDDHVPLLAASIKAIDIIDFEYPWWHTTGDTPDKCSPQSLERVGRLMMSLVNDPL